MKDHRVLLIEIKPDTCDFCGCCVGVCPEDAIELQEARIAIIAERCTNCAKCVWVCPFEALVFLRPTRTPRAIVGEADLQDGGEKTSTGHGTRG